MKVTILFIIGSLTIAVYANGQLINKMYTIILFFTVDGLDSKSEGDIVTNTKDKVYPYYCSCIKRYCSLSGGFYKCSGNDACKCNERDEATNIDYSFVSDYCVCKSKRCYKTAKLLQCKGTCECEV